MIRRIVALVLIAAVAGACGGPSTAEKDAAAAKAQAKKEAEEKAAELAQKQARYDQCNTTAADLLSDLQTLDSKLSVGMVYRDYNDAVGNAQAKLDVVLRSVRTQPDLKAALLDSGCSKRVLIPLGTALAKYAHASDVWTDCLRDLYCDIDSGPESDKLDADWVRATKLIDNATKHLHEMEPAPATPSPSSTDGAES